MLYTLGENGTLSTRRTADVVWVFRRSRRQWLSEWLRGERSSEFFYGLPSLCARYCVGFVEDEGSNPLWFLWYPFEFLMSRRNGVGFALHVPLWHLRALNRARVIISTMDTCGLPLAFLKRLGLLSGRLIYISQGLSDRIKAYGFDKRLSRQYGRLLSGVEELVALSPGAAAGLADWLDIPSDRIHVLPFGADCHFWRHAAPPGAVGSEIVSVGSDAGRDYSTLLAACDRLPLHIVSRQRLTLRDRANVRQSSDHTPRELREIYSRARFVVIPLFDIEQPSGQSTALQAMACGKAVVLTRTRGWWGGDRLRDGENCVVVPPGDAQALREALWYLWSNPATCGLIGQKARNTVESYFGVDHMTARLSELISLQLSSGAPDAEGLSTISR